MPYAAIKLWPKDKETKERVAEKVSTALVEALGCPPQAVTISIEEIEPADWEEKVVKTEIEPKQDAMVIVAGKKCL